MTKIKNQVSRINLGSINHAIDYPDFLGVQLESFQKFFQLETPPEDREEEGLFKVFSKIFPIVKIFDYKHLFDSPELVFEKIGHIAGFFLSDRSLVNTRLGGLANRFMLYNTFTLVVDNQTQKIWEDTGIEIGEKDGLIHGKISLKILLP